MMHASMQESGAMAYEEKGSITTAAIAPEEEHSSSGVESDASPAAAKKADETLNNISCFILHPSTGSLRKLQQLSLHPSVGSFKRHGFSSTTTIPSDAAKTWRNHGHRHTSTSAMQRQPLRSSSIHHVL